MVGRLMSNELESTEVKRLWPNFRYYPNILQEKLRKTMKSPGTIEVQATIPTGYIANKSQ
jgi:hypothetical protein